MTPFSKSLLSEIKNSIDQALAAGAHPIAAFDADGTLWDMDMGDYFFDYQINKKLLPDLPQDPWATYLKMHSENSPAAFLWLAQINKGLPLEEIRKWTKQAFQNMPELPIFDGVHEIIKHLQKSNVQVYVVTASIKWAVEPGAEYLGIPAENVIGVSTQIRDGIITDQLEGVVTWHEGKVQGLLNHTKAPPFFAAGNTIGDLALLELATHLRLANCGAPQGHKNFNTEQDLIKISKDRGWFVHTY
ncbi:MAG: haloacid dehalogenase-like hydrolase [Bdellovibrionales bacterium]|nr:haloacid dehalogenase-like hydrolase [Bdellovibrionales bacterium]